MPLSVYDSIDQLREYVGKEIAASEWMEITQERIDLFARATEDRQWIHVDPERCKTESPFGTTIAHGFLTLALIPNMDVQAFKLNEPFRIVINYGLNKVRFMAPVTPGSFVRARKKLTQIRDIEGGWELHCRIRIEIRDGKNAAMVADTITRLLK